MPALTDSPMTGFDPNRQETPQAAAPAQAATYEFDPSKEITPMAGRFFADVEADPNIPSAEKLRIQAGYLQGIGNIREQQAKIVAERTRSIMDRQAIEKNQLALAEMRQKQDDVARLAERQKSMADTVKGIVDSKLPPDEKRKQIAMYKIDNAAVIATDPATKMIYDTAEGMIQKPIEQYSLSDAEKTRLIMDDGIPTWIVQSGDTDLIQKAKGLSDAAKKEQSENEKEIEEARKTRSSLITDFAKFEPETMDEASREAAGVSGKDTNPYLTSASQNKGRMIVELVYGGEGLATYDTLPDSERIKMIYRAQRDLVVGDSAKRDTSVKQKVTDNQVDSLLFGKKKR